jgi:hypothetical protein
LASPSAFDWGEHAGFVVVEFFLLLGGEFDHGPGFVRVAESGEDFAADAEVGMVHVGSFFGSGVGEARLAELFGGYGQGFFPRLISRSNDTPGQMVEARSPGAPKTAESGWEISSPLSIGGWQRRREIQRLHPAAVQHDTEARRSEQAPLLQRPSQQGTT